VPAGTLLSISWTAGNFYAGFCVELIVIIFVLYKVYLAFDLFKELFDAMHDY
jgi:hypothetical protein